MKRTLFAAAAALAFVGCKQNPQPPPEATVASSSLRADSKPIPTTPAPVVQPPREQDRAPDPEPIGLSHQGPVHEKHLSRSNELKSIGELDAALVEARRAVFDNPEDEDALKQVARLAQLTRHRELAVNALERLGQLSEDDPQPFIQAARIQVSAGKTDEAIVFARVALTRDPESPDAYHVLGRAFLAQGELSNAIVCFKKAIDFEPDHGYALNNLGFAYLRANMNQEAVDVLERAAEILPRVAYVHNNLGVAYERVGRSQEAELEYAQSTSLSPKYVKARVNSARVKRLAKAQSAPTPSDMDEE